MLERFVLVYGVLAIVGLYVMSLIAQSPMAAGGATLCATGVYLFQLFEYERDAREPMYLVQYVLLAAVAVTGATSFILSIN